MPSPALTRDREDELAARHAAAFGGLQSGGRTINGRPAVPASRLLEQLPFEGEVEVYPELEIRWTRPMPKDEVEAIMKQTRLPATDLATVRAKHHAVARMLVAGAANAEIARALGITPATVANLTKTPTFQALLSEYMAMAEQEAVDLRARIAVVAGLGLDELTARLGDPDKAATLPIKDLREIAMNALDRVGHGPTSRVETASIALTAADIRAMKEARRNGVVYDADATIVLDGGAKASVDAGTAAGLEGPGHSLPAEGGAAPAAGVAEHLAGADAAAGLHNPHPGCGRAGDRPAGRDQTDAAD
jgi:hypothetical protein